MPAEGIASTAEAFAASRDPRLVYVHEAFAAVSAELAFSRLSDRGGLTLLLGPEGCGKTTVLAKFLAEQAAGDCYLYLIGEPEWCFDEFVARCAQAFGLPTEFEDPQGCLRRLSAFLVERQRSGGSAVLIIDQAERLPAVFLENLAEFARMNKAGRRLSHVILAARLGPDDDAGTLAAIAGEVTFRCLLRPLSAREAMPFLRHRQRAAGRGTEDLFDAEAAALIHETCGGLAGPIIRLARAALQLADLEGKAKPDRDLIERAWGRLKEGGGGDLEPAEPQADQILPQTAFIKQAFKAEPTWNLPLDMEEPAAPEEPLPSSLGRRRHRRPRLLWPILAGAAGVGSAATLALVLFLQPPPPPNVLAKIELFQGLTAEPGEVAPAGDASSRSAPLDTAQSATRSSQFLVRKAPRRPQGVGSTRDLASASIARLHPLDAPTRPALTGSQPGSGLGRADAGPRAAPGLAKIADHERSMAQGLVAKVSRGREDMPIPLHLSADLADRGGSDGLELLLSGLPRGASLSAGTPLGEGQWRLDPGELEDLRLSLPANYSGSLDLVFEARPEGAPGPADETSRRPFHVAVAAVADPPNLTLQEARGAEDTDLSLSITASLADRDGSEALQLEIAGLPDGSKLSAGEAAGEVWRLAPEALAGLKFTPPPHLGGALVLTVRAVSREANGDVAVSEGILPVFIRPRADRPALAAQVSEGREDEAMPFGIDVRLADRDGSEALRVFVAGLPTGARLTAGHLAEDGTWVLSPDDLAGLELLPPVNFSGQLTLELTAEAREKSGDLAREQTRLTVVVQPESGPAGGKELDFASHSTLLQKLIERGDQLLALKDVAAARLFYERAATKGDFRALAAVGRTYDPLELRSLGVLGVQGNPAKAKSWYLRGVSAGDPEAVRLWQALDGSGQSAQLE